MSKLMAENRQFQPKLTKRGICNCIWEYYYATFEVRFEFNDLKNIGKWYFWSFTYSSTHNFGISMCHLFVCIRMKNHSNFVVSSNFEKISKIVILHKKWWIELSCNNDFSCLRVNFFLMSLYFSSCEKLNINIIKHMIFFF